jgi:uncharacterized protein (DUF362 family)
LPERNKLKNVKTNRFVDGDQALVSKVLCQGEAKQAISHAVTAIGGFGRLVEPGETILIKPNFNTADPPPASSDPDFIRAAVELLYEHGAGRVIVAESSMLLLSTARILDRAGVLKPAIEAGAEVVDLDKGDWVKVETGGQFLRRVSLARLALDTPKIVYACCLKTHRFADFTMSLKVAMGFVRPAERGPMHLRRLREKLVDLNLAVGPDMVLIDGRRCFIAGGPSQGVVREPNLILASGDRIAVDVEGLKVIQSYPGHSLEADPWHLPMIQQAVQLGLGATNEAAYRVVQ